MANSEPGPWYRRAFGEDYLWLYSHRSKHEAERAVRAALNLLPFEAGQKVLDLACGAGRHMVWFGRNGARVTGVDISPELLGRASTDLRQAGLDASLVRADMRELPFGECFDGVTMWFTSFGYFSEPGDDHRVLKSIGSVLIRNGWWWIDIMNPAHVRAALIPLSQKELHGPYGRARVIERRQLTGDFVIKRTEIIDSHGKRSFFERVRLYPPEMFRGYLEDAGLAPTGTVGDYDGAPFSAYSPRQIWYGVKR